MYSLGLTGTTPAKKNQMERTWEIWIRMVEGIRVSKNWGYLFGAPYTKDYASWGYISTPRRSVATTIWPGVQG